MKKYAAYKSSGDEWLGEVPGHWEVIRADFVTESLKAPVSEAQMEGREIVHYSIPAVQEFGGPITEPGDDISSGKLLIDKRQLLISKLNPRKSTLCIAEPVKGTLTVASTEFVPIVPLKKVEMRYAYYVWGSSKVTHLLSGIVRSVTKSHQRAEPHEIRKILWAWPPLPEQRAIAAFLDERTAHLDGLIRRKEDLLKLLAEQRAALIIRAVTRGLDATAPLQESGVPWLGQVPAHWHVMLIRRLLTVRSGDQTTTEDLQDEGFPVFGGNGFRGYYPDWNTEANSILIGRYGALCGNVRVVKEKVWATEHAFRVFPLMSFNVDFLGFALEAINLNQFSARAAQPGLNATLVRDNFCALPPPLEQSQIVDFIHRSNKRLDKMTDITTREIEKLREYRAALITAAVTGRIDVQVTVAVPELVEA